MDDAEVEWRAHTTHIRRIEVDAEKHQQEVLTTTNVIQDAIKKNNVIFSEKWEATHDCIDRCSEDVEWRFGFMPVRMSTGYRLLVIRCRWRFLATR